MDKYFMLMNPTYTASRILNESLYTPEETLHPKSKAALQHACGRYYPAILLATDFFMAQYVKKNMNLDEMALIIAMSFACNEGYAKKIIKCYRGQEKFINQLLKSAKERPFKFTISLMKDACETVCSHGPIRVPEKLIKNLLLLSNYALPISDIIFAKYNKGDLFTEAGTQIHEDLHHIVNTRIKQLNEIFDTKPDMNFWTLFYRYFPKYSNNGYFLECINLSICLDEEQVYKLMHNTSIHKSTDTARDAMKEYEALREYGQALEDLEKHPSNQCFSRKERNKLIKNAMFLEFAISLGWSSFMNKIANNGLRSCDLKLAYWLLINHNADGIERFLDDLIYDFFLFQ